MQAFTSTITEYGFAGLQPIAPVLVMLEVGVGVGLVLQQHVKKLALFSFALLAAFTLLFAYGVLFRNITSCGCLGALEPFQLPIWASFVRNTFLLMATGWLYRQAPPAPLRQPRNGVLLAAMVLSFVVSGFAYAQRYAGKARVLSQGGAIKASLLAPYAAPDSDSTYLLFLYSPLCPHCVAVTPTVASYATSGLVSRIVALSPPVDPAAQARYVQRFAPPFELHTVERDTLYAVSYSVPVALVIQRGRVTRILGPKMPSADSLRSLLHSNRLPLSAPTVLR